jgi:hypothetical protein
LTVAQHSVIPLKLNQEFLFKHECNHFDKGFVLTANSSQHTFQCDRGIGLPGARIWLDAETKRPANLLASLSFALPPLQDRLLASLPLAEMLQQTRFRGRILPVPWEQWVGLAGYRLKWVANGAPLGSASILITSAKEGTLLYTGVPRLHTPYWPKAHTLLIDGRGLSLQKRPIFTHFFKKILEYIEQCALQSRSALIYVDHLELGAHLASQLTYHQVGPLRVQGLLSDLLPKLPRTVIRRGEGQNSIVLRLLTPQQIQLNIKTPALVLWTQRLDYSSSFQARYPSWEHLDVSWFMDMDTLVNSIFKIHPEKLLMVEPQQTVYDHLCSSLANKLKIEVIGGAQQLTLNL